MFPISTGSWTSSSLPEAASYLADTCTSHGVQGKDEVKMIAINYSKHCEHSSKGDSCEEETLDFDDVKQPFHRWTNGPQPS